MGALVAALGFALLDAVLLVSIAVAPSATADFLKATPLTHEYCTANYGRPRGEQFEWRGFTFQKYLGDAGCESHRQGTYLGTGVTVNADGDLVISARRHCTVDPVGEDSPVSESPCASPQTRYSVGRVRLATFQLPSTDFEWGFDVRLPQRSAPGTRSALWLINLDQIHCDPMWGELDILEWYSSRPDRPEAATHATCTDTAAYTSWHHKPDNWAWGKAAGRPSTGGPYGNRRSATRSPSATSTTTGSTPPTSARSGFPPRPVMPCSTEPGRPSSRQQSSATGQGRSRAPTLPAPSPSRNWSFVTCGSNRCEPGVRALSKPFEVTRFPYRVSERPQNVRLCRRHWTAGAKGARSSLSALGARSANSLLGGATHIATCEHASENRPSGRAAVGRECRPGQLVARTLRGGPRAPVLWRPSGRSCGPTARLPQYAPGGHGPRDQSTTSVHPYLARVCSIPG